MNPASKDIATLLNDNSSLGLTLGTDLFYARMPDSPQNCTTVFDNPGASPMLTIEKPTSNYFYSSVTVQVRNTVYETGYTELFDILTYLHAESGIIIGDVIYTLIKAENEPQLLGWDDNDRAVFFVNFEVQRRNS